MFIVMWVLPLLVLRLAGLQGFHFRLPLATTNHAERDVRPSPTKIACATDDSLGS
jgi:hypothetical protein